ncbi:hypothetical protein GCM10020229_33950 [Kitasatospora albolonga]|uniref:LysR family transcriptional regulator n=1 Tax=Kitasatospora albolonga TaxID=68173 RepID=UPI0031EEF3D7
MATLRQYEYLVTVVETGSFTRAAELLHVSQPALSHQVRALERECGGPLLERLPRSVRLTPMGREVEPHARAALAGAERARAAARRAAGLDGGELQLAVVYSVALGVLPPVLRALAGPPPAGAGAAARVPARRGAGRRDERRPGGSGGRAPSR